MSQPGQYLKNKIDKYILLVVLISIIGISRSAVQVFWFREPFKIHRDSKLFYHIGSIMQTGHVPYVDVWEVKPPLTYETAAIISFLGGRDPTTTHAMGVIFTYCMVLGVAVLLYILIKELFNDSRAGVLTAAVWLSYPAVHYFPALGFRVKYFALFFGILGLYLAVQHRWVLSGVATAFGAAYWQFAIVFCILAIGISASHAYTKQRSFRNNWHSIAAVSFGFVVSFIIVVLPIFLSGGFFAMISEVIISGLIAGEEANPIRRLGLGLLKLKSAFPLVILGVAGFGYLVKEGVDCGKWISLGGILFAIQIFFLDFDGAPDLLGGYVFIALGVGGFYAVASDDTKKYIMSLVLVCLVVSTVLMGGTGTVIRPIYEDRPNQPDQAHLTKGVRVVGEMVGGKSLTGERREGNSSELRSQLGLPSIDEIYRTNWDPTTCHYFLSNAEKKWVQKTNAEWGDKQCGADSIEDIYRLLTQI